MFKSSPFLLVCVYPTGKGVIGALQKVPDNAEMYIVMAALCVQQIVL